jgi:hypothetical protein
MSIGVRRIAWASTGDLADDPALKVGVLVVDARIRHCHDLVRSVLGHEGGRICPGRSIDGQQTPCVVVVQLWLFVFGDGVDFRLQCEFIEHWGVLDRIKANLAAAGAGDRYVLGSQPSFYLLIVGWVVQAKIKGQHLHAA